MFGIGFQEMLIILVVILVIFGPKRLPDLAKSLGKGIAEFKKASEEVRKGIEEAVQEEESKAAPPAAESAAARETAPPPPESPAADPPPAVQENVPAEAGGASGDPERPPEAAKGPEEGPRKES